MRFIENSLPNNFIQLRQLDQYLIGHKGFIAGGVFKNIFNNEKVKDIDIFFENEKDWYETYELFKKDKDYEFEYQNGNVVAYKNKHTNVVVELVKHTYGKPKDILNRFDFTITKFAYYKEENENDIEWKIIYHDRFFEHLHLKRLVIDQDHKEIIKPANTFNRMFKYAKYGYFPCRETKVKIINALRDLSVFDESMLSKDLYFGLD